MLNRKCTSHKFRLIQMEPLQINTIPIYRNINGVDYNIGFKKEPIYRVIQRCAELLPNYREQFDLMQEDVALATGLFTVDIVGLEEGRLGLTDSDWEEFYSALQRFSFEVHTNETLSRTAASEGSLHGQPHVRWSHRNA